MLESSIILNIQESCKHPCGQRSLNSLISLINFTKGIPLFKDLIEKQGKNTHVAICQYLLFESFGPQQYIFKHGDIGNKFYILISGTVSIEIPINDSGRTTYKEVMTFTSGGSFGELALESSKPRSASALSKTSTNLLVLLQKDYHRLIQRFVTEKKNEMVIFLQSLPAFSKVNKLALSKLTYNIVENSYRKAQFLFREGDSSKNIFIIRNGEFKVRKSILKPDSAYGIKKIKRTELHTAKVLGEGAMVGEEDTLNKRPHSYSCICNSETAKVYSVSVADFLMRITAEQPLQYLRSNLQEKIKFLDSWKNMRSSLDNMFYNEPFVERKKIKKNSDGQSVAKLNRIMSERKKLGTSNGHRFSVEINGSQSRNIFSQMPTSKNQLVLPDKHRTSSLLVSEIAVDPIKSVQNKLSRKRLFNL